MKTSICMLLSNIFRTVRNNLPLALLVAATAAMFGIPLVIACVHAAGVWQGIPPAHIEDALFYYSRLKEIVDGNFLFGNPAYIEHAQEISASFSLSEWVAAVPLALTSSWGVTILWNNIFWPLVSSLIFYFFFRRLGAGKWLSAAGSLLVLAQTVLLFERPVIMQIPYTAFAAFMLAFISWLHTPSRGRSLAAAFVIAFAAGSWLFLGEIIALVCIGTLLFCLISRDWPRARELLKIGIFSCVIVSPMVLMQLPLLGNVAYPDMLSRFGLVISHIPALDAWYYGRWMLVLCAGLISAAIVFWNDAFKQTREGRGLVMLIILSCAVLVVLCSPLLTGKDVNNASHAGRFIFLIIAAGAVLLLHCCLLSGRWRAMPRLVLAIVAGVILLSAGGLAVNIAKRNVPHIPATREIAEVQEYAAPLGFLEKREPKPVVVWANTMISPYIPVATKHYVLFVDYGGYALVPSEEIYTRYLTSIYPTSTPSVEALAADAGTYDLGRVTYEPESQNRQGEFCRMTSGLLFPDQCVRHLSYAELRGSAFFESFQEKYAREISPRINEYLDLFHVRYVIRDRSADAPIAPESIRAHAVYDDGRFVIYERQ